MTKKSNTTVGPTPRSRSDLSWFFCEAESAMGIKSNMGSILAHLETGIADDGSRVQIDSMSWGRLVAAERYGRIEAILREAGSECYNILEVVYTSRQLPVAIKEYFAEAAPLALVLPLTRRLYKHSESKSPMIDWLCKIVVMGSKADKDALKTIRVKADAIIQSAYKAYERAARLAPKDDEDTNA